MAKDMTEMIEIGAAMRERREELGVSKRQLAKLMTCSSSCIGHLERGEHNWTRERKDEYFKCLHEVHEEQVRGHTSLRIKRDDPPQYFVASAEESGDGELIQVSRFMGFDECLGYVKEKRERGKTCEYAVCEKCVIEELEQ